MERQRLPLVQLEVGAIAFALRSGLTNGSRLPAAPRSLAGVRGFGSGLGAPSTRATLGLEGLLLPPAFLTAGLFAAAAFLTAGFFAGTAVTLGLAAGLAFCAGLTDLACTAGTCLAPG